MARKTKRSKTGRRVAAANAPSAPSKPRKKVVRSTRRARGDQDVLDDARLVARVARANLKGFQKYDAARQQKLLPATRLTAYDAQIQRAGVLVGGRRTAKVATVAATRTEEKARVVVFDLVSEARGVIKAGVKNDASMLEACLVGVSLDPKSTSRLITAAADLQQALEKNKGYRERAAKLGITKAFIATLVAARRALILADTSQGEAAGVGVATTAEKTAARKELERETAYVRSVAKLAFKGQPKILNQFRPQTPRAIARPKKPAAGGGGTSPAT